MAKEIVQHQALVLEQRGELLTTSVIIANQLGAKHSDFLPVINKYLDTDFSRCAEQRIVKGEIQCFYPSSYKTTEGNEYRMWLLNEAAFMKIMTLTQRYKKADEVVNNIIVQFKRMQALLLRRQNASWQQARIEGKVARHEETDIIKDFIKYAIAQGSQSAEKYYVNITKMENQALFLVEQKYPNLREVLSEVQLGNLKVCDRIVARALKKGMEQELHYKDCYKFAKDRVIAFAELIGRTTVPNNLLTTTQSLS